MIEQASKTTRVLVIRHGETVWNALGRQQGQLDTELNARGIARRNGWAGPSRSGRSTPWSAATWGGRARPRESSPGPWPGAGYRRTAPGAAPGHPAGAHHRGLPPGPSGGLPRLPRRRPRLGPAGRGKQAAAGRARHRLPGRPRGPPRRRDPGRGHPRGACWTASSGTSAGWDPRSRAPSACSTRASASSPCQAAAGSWSTGATCITSRTWVPMTTGRLEPWN